MSSTTTPDPKRAAMFRMAWIGLALVAFLIPWVVTFPDLSPAGHRVFSVFLLALVLWVTEAIPLHATAAIIIFLEILLVSDKSILPTPDGFTPPSYATFYQDLAHPVLMLFLGGFFLADCAAKYRLDRNLARILLRPFGKSPKMIMLGLMIITAILSMFMSNTATTATMMAVVLPVLMTFPATDRMRTAIALSIPVAANIGGIGTPVGTPPNAIALSAMSAQGIDVTFVAWMAMTIPFVIITLLFGWQLLVIMFPASSKEVELKIDSTFDLSWQAKVFYATAILTIGLWLTEPFHGIKSTIVGFVPVVVLLSSGVFSKKDMQSLQWPVLWLLAGGIALGSGVKSSGLDEWLIGLVSWETMPIAIIPFILALAALLMGSAISHSATANLLVPIGMSLAMSDAVAVSPLTAGVFIAIGSSLAMALPISTPPNAIAYATGTIKTKDMAISGIVIGAFGIILFVFVAPKVWTMLGLFPQ